MIKLVSICIQEPTLWFVWEAINKSCRPLHVPLITIHHLPLGLAASRGFPTPTLLPLYISMYLFVVVPLLWYIMFSALARWARVYCHQVQRSYQVTSQIVKGKCTHYNIPQ